MKGENQPLVRGEPVDTWATPKPQQLQSPKTSALRILRKYRAGISVGWIYWSMWKKGGSLQAVGPAN